MYQNNNFHTYPYRYGAYGNNTCGMQPCPYWINSLMQTANPSPHVGSLQTRNTTRINLRDYGPQPLVINMDDAAEQNNAFRTALWTGDHLQVTLMSLNPGEDIGLEVHPDVDQFIRIEEGRGRVVMGSMENQMDIEENVSDDYVIIIPAGTWHNLTNTGNSVLKLFSIYAPPAHPQGTVHATKQDAMEAEMM